MATLGPDGGIARDLAANGFGTFDEAGATGNIFVGEEPPRPDTVLVVLATAGGRMPSDMSEEWLITVRSRDPSYEQAFLTLRNAAIHLQDKYQGDFGGFRIGRLAPSGTPAVLGRDDVKRWRVEQIFSTLFKRSLPFV